MWNPSLRKITDIKPHTNADRLELVFIDGWQCVTLKNQFQVGQEVLYFPIDTLIPEKWLGEWGLSGKLSGPRKNRIKAVRLRGEYSVGIIQANSYGLTENSDVVGYFGLEKYEEPIPHNLRGKIISRPRSYLKYDIENINNNTKMFEGQEIRLEEKYHGCHMEVGLVNGEFKVCSRNLCLDEEESNLYWQMAKKYNLENILRDISKSLDVEDDIWFHGEIIGVQDLQYGVGSPEFILFDVRLWKAGLHHWYPLKDVEEIANRFGLSMANRLYCGQYSLDIVKQYGVGMETYSGKELHIREGCVIKLLEEKCPSKGCSDRIVAKYVNPEYMIRKNGTELH